jgi:CRP-like cAMP-binding protein
LGQWISVGDNPPGQIVERNWRATRIEQKSGDLVIYPNGYLARSRIVNFDAPKRLHRVTFDVKLDNDESPARAADVLQAAVLSAKGVLRSPAPSIQVAGFGDWSINYRVIFWIADFSTENAVVSAALTAIWTHLSWAGISRPLPRSVVSLERARASDEIEDLERLLARMSVFAPLAESERLHLAGELERVYVPHGTRLINEGDEGRSLFIVREGLFSICVRADGVERKVAELRPGDYFGEASLLTGAPRNASVEALTEAEVFELDKEAVAALLAQRSEVADELARALAEREAARAQVPVALHNGAAHGALAEAASRIRSFLLG